MLKINIKHIFLLGCIILMLSKSDPLNGANIKDNFKDQFFTLDSLLNKRNRIIEIKEREINLNRNYLQKASDNHEQLVFSRKLLEAYYNYDTDSAIFYAEKVKHLIQSLPDFNQNQAIDIDLVLADQYILSGDFTKAEEILNALPHDKMNIENKTFYYEVKEHQCNTKAVFMASASTDWQSIKNEINQYRDSIISLQPILQDRWLWVPLARKIDNDDNVSLSPEDPDAQKLISYLNSHTAPSEINAVNAYWLFRFYRALGEQEKSLEYLLKGSIIDEQMSNRELVTLQELAKFLIEQGYYTDAFKYMQWAIINASALKNRSRIVDVLARGISLSKYYQKEKIKADRKIKGLVITVSIVAFILLAAVAVAIISLIKLRKTQKILRRQNGELNLNTDLLKHSISEKNDEMTKISLQKQELNENIYRKREMIISNLSVISDLLHFIQNYQRELLKNYRKNNTKELGFLINDPDFNKEIYNDFFKKFDAAILTLYPEFLKSYNNKVTDEYKVDIEQLKKKKTLNTRIRIFALYSLGVEKSSEIARILNVALQTVYNAKAEFSK